MVNSVEIGVILFLADDINNSCGQIILILADRTLENTAVDSHRRRRGYGLKNCHIKI
jgi:hypothetical protein